MKMCWHHCPKRLALGDTNWLCVLPSVANEHHPSKPVDRIEDIISSLDGCSASSQDVPNSTSLLLMMLIFGKRIISSGSED